MLRTIQNRRQTINTKTLTLLYFLEANKTTVLVAFLYQAAEEELKVLQTRAKPLDAVCTVPARVLGKEKILSQLFGTI